VQYHFLAEYIITDAVVTETDSPLAVSGADACKLFYVELTACIVRVFG
jgi:hypothetical protein